MKLCLLSARTVIANIAHKLRSNNRKIGHFRINQSINQSTNFYTANTPGVARLSGATSKSELDSKIDEAVSQRQQVIGHAGVYGGKARSKRYVLTHFPKVETEVDGGEIFWKMCPSKQRSYRAVITFYLQVARG